MPPIDLSNVPVYRRPLTREAARGRPLIVFCEPREALAALRQMASRYGRKVDGFVFYDHFFFTLHRLKSILCRMANFFARIRVMPLSDLAQCANACVVVFGQADGYEHQKSLSLAERGCREFYFFASPNYFEQFRHEPDFFARHRAKLEAVNDLLEDEESRAVLRGVIKHRMTIDISYLRLSAFKQYAHPLVKAEPGDTLMHAGLESGSDADMFVKQVGESGRVFGFEPDPLNIARVPGRIMDKITVVAAGLGDQESWVAFSARGDGCSGIRSDGGASILVRITSIDAFMESMGIARCDMITLDVEGYELEILRGALKTIQRHKPKLQISVYHKQAQREDLVDLPLFIAALGQGYRFWLGHHGSWGAETILYAKCDGGDSPARAPSA